MSKTTTKDFQKFIKFTKYWIDFFSLKRGWKISFIHGDVDGSDTAATTYCDINNRMITIKLAGDWGDDNITDESLNKIAFHEICEVLLMKIQTIAISRYITDTEVNEELHSIIRTLENCVFEQNKQ